MTRNKKNTNLEEFKYLIDSRNSSSKERKEEREAILKARELRFRDRSKNDIKTARLLQLKYQMEDYLLSPVSGSELHFTGFLKFYIDTLYEKRKNFASDIDITPLRLSHVINKHREPKDKFLFRLILHSQNTFKGLCDFDKDLWPRVYYQDKVCNLLASSKKWIRDEKKHVKGKPVNVPD